MKLDHVICSSETITIRGIADADKDAYLDMLFDNGLLKALQEAGESVNVDIREILWKERFESDSILFLIIENSSQKIIGFCEIDAISEDEPTVGITLLKDYQGKGYGYIAVKMMLEEAWKVLDHPYLVWEVHEENEASKRLVSKLGGVRINNRCAIPDHMLKVLQEGGMDIEAKDFSESIERYKLERPECGEDEERIDSLCGNKDC